MLGPLEKSGRGLLIGIHAVFNFRPVDVDGADRPLWVRFRLLGNRNLNMLGRFPECPMATLEFKRDLGLWKDNGARLPQSFLDGASMTPDFVWIIGGAH